MEIMDAVLMIMVKEVMMVKGKVMAVQPKVACYR